MSRDVVAPPAVLPVGLQELKDQIRVDTDGEDVLLGEYIATAVELVQHKANRQLITATIRETFSEPCGSVILQASPFQSVVSCVDGDGAPVSYTVDTSGLRAVLTPATGVSKLVVTYEAGYGDDPSTVPYCARAAVRTKAAWLWRYRGDESPPSIDAALDALLAPIKLKTVGVA